MKKPKSQAKLKKELDSWFSKYVRLSYANSDGFVNCYTCGKYLHWKKIQNGHFISRGYLATRYHLFNTRPQCWGCNAKHLGNGKTVEFAKKLEAEKKGITMKLYKEAQKIIKDFPYEELIEKYKPLVKEMEKTLG